MQEQFEANIPRCINYILSHGSLDKEIQGLPSGFDIKYLALADRNMQVRFGLKVVWES